jgi:hypothetical protein
MSSLPRPCFLGQQARFSGRHECSQQAVLQLPQSPVAPRPSGLLRLPLGRAHERHAPPGVLGLQAQAQLQPNMHSQTCSVAQCLLSSGQAGQASRKKRPAASSCVPGLRKAFRPSIKQLRSSFALRRLPIKPPAHLPTSLLHWQRLAGVRAGGRCAGCGPDAEPLFSFASFCRIGPTRPGT